MGDLVASLLLFSRIWPPCNSSAGAPLYGSSRSPKGSSIVALESICCRASLRLLLSFPSRCKSLLHSDVWGGMEANTATAESSPKAITHLLAECFCTSLNTWAIYLLKNEVSGYNIFIMTLNNIYLISQKLNIACILQENSRGRSHWTTLGLKPLEKYWWYFS